VAAVTGAASGIGLACTEAMVAATAHLRLSDNGLMVSVLLAVNAFFTEPF
jgi:NAD(P)-dependent dehydrogenase (short-subunit alcohol dehydrogenase family)